MYKIIKTDSSFSIRNGSVLIPIITLADEYGGRSQISLDDNCYILYNKKCGTNYYVSVKHWYKEAAYAMQFYFKIKIIFRMGLLETFEFIRF